MEQVLSDDSVGRLAAAVVRRQASFLADSTAIQHENLMTRFGDRRVLVLGGSGFIATQTLRFLLRFRPAYVGIVDVSENGLAESIRAMRSGDLVPDGTVVEPWLVDVTAPALLRMTDEVGPIDQVMNFAAVKHVRSERDLPSLLRMLQVNVLGSYLVARALSERNPAARQFVVSTDKAADPANFMGASKRAMELAAVAACPSITTARFANVAFSSGSLLESWLRRVVNRQPLAVPTDTHRYFVTPEESGHLCALAAIAEPAHVVVPSFAADRLIDLSVALETVLRLLGHDVLPVQSVHEGMEAIASGVPGWPVVFTPRDTAGEKEAEVFTGRDERSTPWIDGLRMLPIGSPDEGVQELLAAIETWTGSDVPVTVDDIHRAVARAVPNFMHITSPARLDDRA